MSRLPVIALAACLPDDNQAYRCLTYKKGNALLLMGLATTIKLEVTDILRASREGRERPMDEDDDGA